MFLAIGLIFEEFSVYRQTVLVKGTGRGQAAWQRRRKQ